MGHDPEEQGQKPKLTSTEQLQPEDQALLCYLCCDTEKTKTFRLCETHYSCADCLSKLFNEAIINESNYPPRCHKDARPLDVDDFRQILKEDHGHILSVFEVKTQEYQHVADLRSYCAKEECSTFLPPSTFVYTETKTEAACIKCNEVTCIKCGKLQHTEECAYQPPPANTMFSDEIRVKKCPSCDISILLQDGCNHLSCPCGATWCFVCRGPWNGHYEHTTCGSYGDLPCDAEGFDTQGYHRDTGLDRNGFHRRGVNIEGRDRNGQPVAGFADLSNYHEEDEHDIIDVEEGEDIDVAVGGDEGLQDPAAEANNRGWGPWRGPPRVYGDWQFQQVQWSPTPQAWSEDFPIIEG